MLSCYELRRRIEHRAPVARQTCALWGTQGQKTCTDLRDDGKESCNHYEDQGHTDCERWGKSCWLCKAFQWVCDAWYWVANVVCVAAVWVAYWVCYGYTWVTFAVCLALVSIVRWIVIGFSYLVWLVCLSFESVTRTFECFRDTPRNPLEKPGWTLTFEDDFPNAPVDSAKWLTHPNWWPNLYNPDPLGQGKTPILWYDPAGFAFGPSTVKLVTRKQAMTGQAPDGSTFTIPYSTAWLEWHPKQDQRLGYFEIRCKIPDAPDMWPAFWLYLREGEPMEIDIFEFYTRKNTQRFESTQHWGTSKDDHHKETKKHRVCLPAKRFRIYACEWNEEEIRWYLDNRLVRVTTRHMSDFKYPMYLIVNSSIDYRPNDGKWNHHQTDLENSTYPNYFEVDYVRAYSR